MIFHKAARSTRNDSNGWCFSPIEYSLAGGTITSLIAGLLRGMRPWWEEGVDDVPIVIILIQLLEIISTRIVDRPPFDQFYTISKICLILYFIY